MDPASGPRRRLATIGLAAVTLTFLAACASSGSAPTAHGRSPASTTLTPRQALRAAETDADNLSSVVDTFSVRARGALPSTTTGIMRTQLKPTLKASADIRSDASGVNTTMRTVATDDAVYLDVGSAPDFPRPLGGSGRPWVRFGLTGLKTMAGAIAGLGDQVPIPPGADISVHLRISQLATNVHVAGTQVTGGVLTTEYAGSYRPDEVLKALPASERKKLTQELPAFSDAGRVSFREWIDSQHHLRKLVEVGTADGTTTTSTDYYTAFNQPVHVTLPPASQVTDLFNL